jgi:hypothetical protein
MVKSVIEAPKKDLLCEEFPSDSSSNNMNHMMNIPDDDEEEIPQFGNQNPYSSTKNKK